MWDKPDKPLGGCHPGGYNCWLSLGSRSGGSRTPKVVCHCHCFTAGAHSVSMTSLADIDMATCPRQDLLSSTPWSHFLSLLSILYSLRGNHHVKPTITEWRDTQLKADYPHKWLEILLHKSPSLPHLRKCVYIFIQSFNLCQHRFMNIYFITWLLIKYSFTFFFQVLPTLSMGHALVTSPWHTYPHQCACMRVRVWFSDTSWRFQLFLYASYLNPRMSHFSKKAWVFY